VGHWVQGSDELSKGRRHTLHCVNHCDEGVTHSLSTFASNIRKSHRSPLLGPGGPDPLAAARVTCEIFDEKVLEECVAPSSQWFTAQATM